MKNLVETITQGYANNIWPDYDEVNILVHNWRTKKEKDLPDGNGLCGCNLIEYQALFDIVKRLNPKTILEIGSGYGASTVILCLASDKNCLVTQVDPVETDTISLCFELYQRPQKLTHHQIKSEDFWNINSAKFDCILIDGDHDPVVSEIDVHEAVKCMSDNGIVAVHDIIQPRSEYIADWCRDASKEHNKKYVLLDNTKGHGIGLIF